MQKYLIIVSIVFSPLFAIAGSCDHPDQRDSLGRRCGGRAASVRPGGRLGGDGRYVDSYGRDRVWGKNNDPYDSSTSSFNTSSPNF